MKGIINSLIEEILRLRDAIIIPHKSISTGSLFVESYWIMVK